MSGLACLLFFMKITLQHNEFTIEVFDDSVFARTVDSPTSYDTVIQEDKDKQYSPTSQHAIKIFKESNLIGSGIILASGGATGVYSDMALIDNENLIIRCSNKVFC